jgi:hypothetical protein
MYIFAGCSMAGAIELFICIDNAAGLQKFDVYEYSQIPFHNNN